MTAGPVSRAASDAAHLAMVRVGASRTAMCAALADGRAWTVGELGRCAGLTRSAAVEQVDALVAAGIATDIRPGRHRYVRRAGPIEAWIGRQEGDPGSVATASPARRPSPANESLRRGRTCYRHLAGRLGVAVTDALVRSGLVDADWAAGDGGRAVFSEWGISARRVPDGRGCLDFTERRLHLAGPLGTAICTAFFSRGWVTRVDDTRAARLTAAGRTTLAGYGLRLPSECTDDIVAAPAVPAPAS